MAKKVASFRLEDGTLDWVGSYAKSRGVAQAVIVEQALVSYRQDAEMGVPDLPEAGVAVSAVKPSKLARDAEAAQEAERRAREAIQAARRAHQAKLNEAKYR